MKKNRSRNQVYSEIWLSRELNKFEISKEESLRGKDNKFTSCLYLEFSNTNDAMFSMSNAEKFFLDADIGTYQLISYLSK